MSIQANFPAIKPTLLLDFANTEALDPRITFTRASTGTYYDGKTVAKAEENLLAFSEQFDNGVWVKSNASVTANSTIAPDGTTTADTVTITGSGLFLQQVAVIPGATYTVSFYALAGSATTVNYFIYNVTNASTLVATTNYSPLINSSTWTRVSFSFTVPAGCSSIYVDLSRSSSNGTLFLWGAQLEQRSFATAYTPTTTAPITNYIPVLQTASAGTPRFDHNPITGESLGLLIEEQRTNLLLRSEEFDNASWVKSGANIAANAVVSPDGTVDADKLTEDTSTGNHECRQALASTVTGSYTGSVYIKAAGRSRAVLILFGTNFAYVDATFNLANGTVVSGNGSGTITPVGNGYYRCTITGAASSAGNTNLYIRADNGTTSSYTGDGTSGLFIYGAQLEAGAFATSYIPTVASQVTRAADSAVMTGANFSSWFNQSAGTISAEFDVVSTAGLGMSVFSIAAPSNNGYLLYKGASQAGLYAYTDNNFSNSLGNLSANTLAKAAIAYNGISNAGILNGAAPLSIVPVAVKTPTQMQIGASSGVTLSGRIRKITYYPARVTNAQLQALTS